MGKRLYVGGLPFETTEEELNKLFAPCGQVVSINLVINSLGQSKGTAYIEMTTAAEAQVAIEKVNNCTVGSRRIVVCEARS